MVIEKQDIYLGLANAGSSYGVLKKAALSPEILNFLWTNGISKLDSSNLYPNAEHLIQKSGKKWYIQKKIRLPEIELNKSTLIEIFKKNVSSNNGINTILIHNDNLYLRSDAILILQTFRNQAELLGIQRFGISIYRPSELENLSTLDGINVIQFPHNLFDSNCFSWIQKNLSNSLIVKQARSIFLQGLIFASEKNVNTVNKELAKSIRSWQIEILEQNKNPLDEAINYVFTNPHLSEAVVGIESISHAMRLFESIEGVKPYTGKVYSLPVECTDPRSWRN